MARDGDGGRGGRDLTVDSSLIVLEKGEYEQDAQVDDVFQEEDGLIGLVTVKAGLETVRAMSYTNIRPAQLHRPSSTFFFMMRQRPGDR